MSPTFLRPLASLVVLAGTLVAAPALAFSVTPETIMHAQENLTYAGMLMINGMQRVHILHGEGAQQRQEYFGKDGRLVDLLISDGQLRWHYSPREKLVHVTPLDASPSLSRRLALLHQNYDFQVMGLARRASRPVIITRFQPRHKGNLVHLLWVDQETNLPLAVERRQDDGELVDRSEYVSIQFHPHLSLTSFRFNVPEGCHVQSTFTVLAHGQAETPPPRDLSFHPPLPRQLPPGYALLNWEIFESNNRVPTYNWHFHDGLNPLSLFAVEERHQAHMPPEAKTVSFAGHPGFLLQHGSERLLMWNSNGTSYTLVGHLPEADLEQVASSTL